MPSNTRRTFLAGLGLAGSALGLPTDWLAELDRAAATEPATTDWPMLYGGGRSLASASDGSAPREEPYVRWSQQVPDIDGAPSVVDGVAYVGGRRDRENEPWQVRAAAVDVADGRVRWERTLDARASGQSAAPTVGTDTVVYLGEETVHGLSKADGTERWSVSTDGSVVTAPAVVDGTVYVGTDAALHALDAATGAERWRFDAPAQDTLQPMPSPKSYARVAVNGETVYLVSTAPDPDTDRGTLFALSTTDGSVQWRTEAYGDGWPTVTDDIVVTTSGAALTAHDRTNGSTAWTASLDAAPDAFVGASPAIVGDRALVATYPQVGDGGQVTAVSLNDGRVDWSFSATFPKWVVGAGDVAYVGFNSSEVRAVDPADGATLWSVSARDTVGSWSVPAVTGDGLFFVDLSHNLYRLTGTDAAVAWRTSADSDAPTTTDDAVVSLAISETGDRVTAIETADGDERWTYAPSDATLSTALAADGDVVVGGEGRLVVLDGDTGDPRWAVEAEDTFDVVPAHTETMAYTWDEAATEQLAAYDLASGERRWGREFATCPGVDLRVTADADGLYLGGQDLLRAVNADSSLRWTVQSTGLELLATDETVGSDGVVHYAADAESIGDDPTLAALDAADGTERWATTLRRDVRLSHLAANDETLYAVGIEPLGRETPSRSVLYAFDGDSGTLRWEFELDPAIGDGPADDLTAPAAVDGVVFAADDRTLYAVDADDGTERGRAEQSAVVRAGPVATEDAVYLCTRADRLVRVDRAEL